MGFCMITSSPIYPQSNGQAERTIKTVKKLYIKTFEEGSDPYVALLQYRNAPSGGCTFSPAQLLMSRVFRTKLIMLNHLLVRQWPMVEISFAKAFDTVR